MNGRLGGCGVIAEKKAVLKRRHKVALAPLPANKSGQECVGIYTKKNEEAENGKIFAKHFRMCLNSVECDGFSGLNHWEGGLLWNFLFQM